MMREERRERRREREVNTAEKVTKCVSGKTGILEILQPLLLLTIYLNLTVGKRTVDIDLKYESLSPLPN